MPAVELSAVPHGHAREALVQATIDLAARVGLHGVTVAELSVAARVGPRTFYNHFADLDDAFFEVCRQMHDELRQTIQDAYEGETRDEAEVPQAPGYRVPATSSPTSRARAQRCVEALFAFIQADPVRAQVLFVQSHSGGPAITALRRETVEWLTGLVQEQARTVVGPGPGRLLAEMAVGGINEVLSSRIIAGELDRLDEWVSWAVDTLMWSTGTRR